MASSSPEFAKQPILLKNIAAGITLNVFVVCISAGLIALTSSSAIAFQTDFVAPAKSLLAGTQFDQSPSAKTNDVGSTTIQLDADKPIFKERNPDLIFRGQSPVMMPQIGSDPFLQPPGMVDPYAGLPGGGFLYGATGPQPYRIGAQPILDMFYTPEESTSLGSNFESWGFDLEVTNTQPSTLFPGTMFSLTPQFGMRNFSGPDSIDMPESVFRTGFDLKWESAQAGPTSFVGAFNPTINSDFEDGLSSDAFNWDARVAMLFQMGGGWRGVLGVQYWDRARDLFIPHVGFIYNSDRWEAKLTVPEAQISYFFGNELGCAKWIYVRGEYNVEAYEIQRNGVSDQMETSDYRIMAGTKMDTGRLNWHLEAGWIFERDVRFKNNAQFDVQNGFITQFGVRF